VHDHCLKRRRITARMFYDVNFDERTQSRR
jgi:hypothetical protein